MMMRTGRRLLLLLLLLLLSLMLMTMMKLKAHGHRLALMKKWEVTLEAVVEEVQEYLSLMQTDHVLKHGQAVKKLVKEVYLKGM